MPITSLVDRLRGTATSALIGHMEPSDALELDVFLSTMDINAARQEVVTISMRVPLITGELSVSARSMSSRVTLPTSALDVGTVFVDAVVEAWHNLASYRDFHDAGIASIGDIDAEARQLFG